LRRPAAAIAALVALSLLGSACTVGPSYKRPPVAVPAQVYGQAAPEAESLADVPWWEVFQDPALRALVTEALQRGYDVRIAAARVEEARARYGIARAAAFPQLGFAAGYQRQHLPDSSTTDPVSTNQIVASVSVGWELDVWGRVRRLSEAARAQYFATEEARRGVMLSLLSEVASAYFELRELDAELANARAAQAAFQETLDLFNRRLAGGAASALETSRAEASLAAVSAEIPALERDIVARENQIDLLLGRVPGPVARGLDLEAQPIPPRVPAGLPSTLLERRPDLRASEQDLVAATANVGAARAQFFPTLSLTGAAGGASSELSHLVGSNPAWTIGAGLLGPIFQGGRIRSQYRVSLAQLEQARLHYEQDVTRALGEVSTSLVALQKLEEAEAQRRRAVTANENAVRLARLRYTSGLSAYFEVLDALQQLFLSENSLTQTRRDRLLSLAQFYEALGGGWPMTPGGPAPETAPRP
jgi:multidrug efflux system outer membrane protein